MGEMARGGNFLSTSETSVTTKCDSFGGSQSAASGISNLCNFHYKVGQLLESGTTLVIKWGDQYKVGSAVLNIIDM